MNFNYVIQETTTAVISRILISNRRRGNSFIVQYLVVPGFLFFLIKYEFQLGNPRNYGRRDFTDIDIEPPPRQFVYSAISRK